MGCCSGECSCAKSNHSDQNTAYFIAQGNAGSTSFFGANWQSMQARLKLQMEVVEVRFKSNHKDFFRVNAALSLKRDDRVVVELTGGYDVGTITLSGERADKKYNSGNGSKDILNLNRVVRLANKRDIQNWLESRRKDRFMLLMARETVLQEQYPLEIHDAALRADGRQLQLFCTLNGPGNQKQIQQLLSDRIGIEIELR